MEVEEDIDQKSDTPAEAAIKYGEATAATDEAKAAGIARGNIQVQDAQAETLQLPEVGLKHYARHSLPLYQGAEVLDKLACCRRARMQESFKSRRSQRWN